MSKRIIACDLFLDLNMYCLPKAAQERLESKFPDFKIVPIGIEGAEKISLTEVEVYWGNRINQKTIQDLRNLRWIHFGSIGVQGAAVPEVKERQIIVTNSKGTMEDSVATAAFAFMISFARCLQESFQLRAEQHLTRKSFDANFAKVHELKGKTCLIVGLGTIGSCLAGYCKAFGMKVTAIKKVPTLSSQHVDEVKGLEHLNELCTEADYVVGILPITPATKGIFNLSVFECMKKESYFINVGRGETVIEEDLIAALKSGKIAGAGIDVFNKTPLPKGSPLWKMSNVMITPHTAAVHREYWDKEISLFETNLEKYQAGAPLVNVVDMDKGY